MAEPDDGRDVGFTLVETIVVLLLVSVLASVMVAVVAVILRNAPATEARTDDSRSYQQLVTWLPRDVASTPPLGFEFGGSSTVCNGAVGGASLVQMTWDPNDGTNVKYGVDYRFGPVPGGAPVVRYTCSGTSSSPPYAGTNALDVTSVVRNAQATPLSSGVGVTVLLTTCGNSQCSADGPTITSEAGSRNPAEALP